MYKIGMSNFGFAPTEENFRGLSENNIDAIEISMIWSKLINLDYKELKALSERYGVELWTQHLPFWASFMVDPSSLDKSVRDNTVKYFTELINKGSDIGIDKFVVHPCQEPDEISAEERRERIKYSMQSLDQLAEIAHRCGAVIAVEDLPRACIGNNIEEMSMLVSANDKLRICFDTNHLLTDDNIAFMKKFGKKIVTVHVSDYDYVDEQHWLPGEGVIDWNKMYNTFKEIGYNGVWMYEIALKTPDTITRERDLTFKDFYDNAMSIFEGKQPKVVK